MSELITPIEIQALVALGWVVLAVLVALPRVRFDAPLPVASTQEPATSPAPA
jgi:hypothetical protein